MKKKGKLLIPAFCVVCILLLITIAQPASAGFDPSPFKAHERIPALNVVSGQAVVVPRMAVERSPVLEPADILVEVDDGAVVILLLGDTDVDPEEFTSSLADAAGMDVNIVAEKPFLWVKVKEGMTLGLIQPILTGMMSNIRHDTAKNIIQNVR
jgi:hypothetical protein